MWCATMSEPNTVLRSLLQEISHLEKSLCSTMGARTGGAGSTWSCHDACHAVTNK